MYKEAKAYKGFESWFHALQMSAKMYLYTFMFVLLLHLLIPIIYFVFFNPDAVRLVFSALSNFSTWHYIPVLLKYIARKGIWVFVLATPIWFLYPAMLSRFKMKSMEIMKDKHMRGSKLVDEKEIRKQIPREAGQLSLGSVPVPRSAETRHFLVLGRPGTGKTTLLNSVIARLRERKEKAIIYDFKGDYLSFFFNPDKDYIFNPLDTRSLHWCLFNEIFMHPDIDSIATSMIPSSSQDRFWTDAARDVFAAILHYCIKTGETSNEKIWQYVSLSEGDMITVMQNALSQGIEEAKRALGYLMGYEKGSKVASDVLSTMKQFTNCFFYTRHLQNDFSIKRWLDEDGDSFLFLTNYSNLRDTLRPLLSLLVDLALKHILSLSENLNRRRFMIIDEFATLQRLPTVVQALEQGRSKGASIWISSQDINQIQKIYMQETMNTIVNTTNTVACFAMNDAISTEYMSRSFGEMEILETDESLLMGPSDTRDGLNISRRRKVERLLLASEFTTLKDLYFYLKMLSYPVTQSHVEIVSYQRKNQPFILNPIFSLLPKEPEKGGET
jgi:type IV secretory pathway TraG/TraD family ATPase VirD4